MIIKKLTWLHWFSVRMVPLIFPQKIDGDIFRLSLRAGLSLTNLLWSKRVSGWIFLSLG